MKSRGGLRTAPAFSVDFKVSYRGHVVWSCRRRVLLTRVSGGLHGETHLSPNPLPERERERLT